MEGDLDVKDDDQGCKELGLAISSLEFDGVSWSLECKEEEEEESFGVGEKGNQRE